MWGSNPLNLIPCEENSYVKDLVSVLAPSLTAEVSPGTISLAASPYQPIRAGQSWKDPIRLLPALGWYGDALTDRVSSRLIPYGMKEEALLPFR